MKKILLLSMLILLCSLCLKAQVPVPQGIAKQVYIEFSYISGLNNQSLYEDLHDFLMDYSFVQLRILYWGGVMMSLQPVHCAMFIYNSDLIDINTLLPILRSDHRITIALDGTPISRPRARQLSLRLHDGVDEDEFLEDYAEYGLCGKIPIWLTLLYNNTILYGFNDATIYAGDFLDILRADERVEVAYLTGEWRDGRLIITIDNNADIQDIRDDYPHINFTSIYYDEFNAWFNYREYNEFSVMNQFNQDERFIQVDFAITWYYYPLTWFCYPPQEPPVSNIENVVDLPAVKISTYPNPVRNESVNFKIIQENSNSHKLNQNPEISIYNTKGQRVLQSIIKEDSFLWNLRDKNNNQVPSGVYLYKINIDNQTQTGKILIIK